MNETPQYTIRKLRKLVIKVCHQCHLSLHHNIRGSKKYDQHQLVALLVLKAREGKSLRRFVQWLYETKWPSWLGLKEIPSHMTIHRALKRLGLSVIRRINQAILSLGKAVKTLCIDATGVDSVHRSRHYAFRVQKINVPYLKLDALLNPDDLLIHDFNIRVKPRNDIIGAQVMLGRNRYEAVQFLGDKAYDSEDLCRKAAKQGCFWYAPVRERTRRRITGFHRRNNSKGHPIYHKRSLSETGFSVLKRCYSPFVRSKKHHMRKRELAWTIIAYNLDRLTKTIKVLLLLLKRATRYRACLSKALIISCVLNCSRVE